jgi:hypothetical protein
MSKGKKKQSNRIGTIPFVLLWILAHGVSWTITTLSSIIAANLFPQSFSQLPIVAYLLLTVGVPTLIYSVAHQWLIQWKFGLRFRWWFLWTTLAAFLAAGSFQIFNLAEIPLLINNPTLAIILLFGYIFGFQALVQTWLLHKHIKQAWLWSVAAIASVATFAISLANPSTFREWNLLVAYGFAGIFQSVVMGLTLVWLFAMTRIEPLKRGRETAQLQRAEENLADRDIVDNDEDYSEAQLMRQQR